MVITPGVSVAFYAGATLASLASLGTAISTNLPATAQSPYFYATKSLGAGAITLDFDLFTMTQTFSAAR